MVKKLLLIGTAIPERLEAFYARSFRELGLEVTFFDPDLELRRVERSRIASRLILPVRHHVAHRALLRFYQRPDWDAVFVVKGQFLAADTIEACRKRARSIPWLILNPDSPWAAGRGATSRHIKESIPLYDTYFIWSQQLLAPLAAAGARRALYLPFAHDEQLHYPASLGELDPSLASSISFIGSYDRERESVLETLADLPLVVFGGGWNNLPKRSPLRNRVARRMAMGPDLRRVTTSSAACLNILRPQNAGAHNMRTFEVPAMRGVMITRRSAEQQELFPENEACLMFEGADELRQRVHEALSEPEAMANLRRRALESSPKHTYLERARTVLREIEALT